MTLKGYSLGKMVVQKWTVFTSNDIIAILNAGSRRQTAEAPYHVGGDVG